LKNEDAEDGLEEDFNYISAPKCCSNDNCLLRGEEYEDQIFHHYDIISRSSNAGITGIMDKITCGHICQLVDSCEFWTFKASSNECFLSKSNKELSYSRGLTSGKKNCYGEEAFKFNKRCENSDFRKYTTEGPEEHTSFATSTFGQSTEISDVSSTTPTTNPSSRTTDFFLSSERPK